MEHTPKTTTAPCRLSVLLAQEAPIGVILRRGPRQRVQIIKWDNAKDTFEPGQWLHGKIHEDRSDLSPDGSKFIYLAAKYGRRQANSEIGCVWTAISKPPYLTAIALWRNINLGTWFGGGVFIDNNTVMLYYPEVADTDNDPMPPNFRPRELKIRASPNFSAWRFRQHRAGWLDNDRPHPTLPLSLEIQVESLSVQLPVMINPFEPHFQIQAESSHIHLPGYSYWLHNKERDLKTLITGATWADWDQQGRLVYDKGGKLFSALLTADGQMIEHELADFSSHKPEPKVTPEWAKAW